MRKLQPASEIDVEIGGRIKAARLSCGMTQAALAEASGIPGGKQIERIEHGLHPISVGRLRKIARALRVPVSSFLPDEIETDEPDILGSLVGMSKAAIALAQCVSDLPPETQSGIFKIAQMAATVTGRSPIPVIEIPGAVTRRQLAEFVAANGLNRPAMRKSA